MWYVVSSHVFHHYRFIWSVSRSNMEQRLNFHISWGWRKPQTGTSPLLSQLQRLSWIDLPQIHQNPPHHNVHPHLCQSPQESPNLHDTPKHLHSKFHKAVTTFSLYFTSHTPFLLLKCNATSIIPSYHHPLLWMCPSFSCPNRNQALPWGFCVPWRPLKRSRWFFSPTAIVPQSLKLW